MECSVAGGQDLHPEPVHQQPGTCRARPRGVPVRQAPSELTQQRGIWRMVSFQLDEQAWIKKLVPFHEKARQECFRWMS